MSKFIPYGRQHIDEHDIAAVTDVLRSDWITTGPAVDNFERAVARFVGADHAVAVSSGTAGLHAAMYAVGIGPGDEVIVPPMTFAATANAVVFQGGTPVFSDVRSDSLLIDPELIERNLSARTKAIVAVDYAGQPCDYDALKSIADKHNLALIADACHSIGAEYRGRKVGTLADISVFSFHPVKHITTGEGGMVVSNNRDYCVRAKAFCNHGITTDHHQRAEKGSWFYEMADIGYNYRITDFQCALGTSQLKKLPMWIARRQEIAQRYDAAFATVSMVEPLAVSTCVSHAYHLYVVKLHDIDRGRVFGSLRDASIGVNVHYIPVYFHPFYRKRFGFEAGLCPVAERAYEQIISLPVFPSMEDESVGYVITNVEKALDSNRRYPVTG